MDPAAILREIGGGLAGVVMVVQFLVIARQNKRIEALTDKLVETAGQSGREAREMHGKTIEGMAALTSATQAATTATQASLRALEMRQ